MEDEKKRKKNKKKKNRQNTTKEDTAVIAEENASFDQHQSSKQDAPSQAYDKAFAPDSISGNSNGENGDVPISDDVRSRNSTNDHEAFVFIAETERKHWLQREGVLEETVNRLQSEKDTHLRKVAQLEMRVVELEHENESLLLKQASMEGTISQLVTEKTGCIAKQASLEERIGQLTEEKVLMNSKHAEYEERIKHLERDKDLWVSKEAKLEETIQKLELDKESWILKQTLTEEMVGRLRDDNARLQNQVKDLEESKIRILQENQMLLENMSGLQVQLQNGDASSHNGHENSEISVLNSQIEAASNLIEKLVTENVDLVEKVNKLYTELDKLGTPSKIASTQLTLPDSDTSVAIDDGTISDTADEINKSLQTDRRESKTIYPVQVASNGGQEGELHHSGVADAPITTNSGEIVQIPLSDSESQDAEGQQTADEDEDSAVELSDAPLTGAPIRFLSFVARYVSGADLVSKNPTNSKK